jgi:hypothetical protein
MATDRPEDRPARGNDVFLAGVGGDQPRFPPRSIAVLEVFLTQLRWRASVRRTPSSVVRESQSSKALDRLLLKSAPGA